MLGDILITYDLPASDEEPALDEEPEERHPPPATAGIGLPTPALAADASPNSVTWRLTDLSGSAQSGAAAVRGRFGGAGNAPGGTSAAT